MTADRAIPTQARTTAIFRKNAAATTRSAATAEMTASRAEEDTNNQRFINKRQRRRFHMENDVFGVPF